MYASISSSVVGQTVSFTASLIGTAANPLYYWDFGDSTTVSNQANPIHTYAPSSGGEEFKPMLRIIDAASPDSVCFADAIDTFTIH